MTTRKVVVAEQFGPPEVLQLVEQPLPEPDADQVLIEIEAAGVNYADVLMRKGQYRRDQTLPLLPGIEIVGRVAQDAEGLAAGTRVVAFPEEGGGYADHAVARRDRTWPVASTLPADLIAGAFLQGITASYAVEMFGRTRPGDWVLVHAAAGGVGGIALQLAKIAGAHVVATASTAEKLARTTAAGADAAVLADPETLAEAVKEATGGHGCDVVVDGVGGPLFDPSYASLAHRGRYVVVGAASQQPSNLDARRLMPRAHTVSGFIVVRVLESDPAEPMQTIDRLLDHVEQGRLELRVDTLPLEQAAEAHRRLEDRSSVGKLVLSP